MRMFIKIAFLIGVGLVVLSGLGWLGLQTKATPFDAPPRGITPERAPLSRDLPAPVARYAEAIYGPDGVPVVQTAIVQGRGRLAPVGPALPSRFRFSYDTAPSRYYHHIRATWFGVPFISIHEQLRDGHTRFDLGPIGSLEDDPNTNRAAMQGYWAEVIAWLPAIALHSDAVRWEARDAHSVILHLPELDAAEALTIHFDPETGLLTDMHTERYQSENDTKRRPWHNQVLEWDDVDGQRVPVRTETWWGDDDPWATWEIEHVVLNPEVRARFATFGD